MFSTPHQCINNGNQKGKYQLFKYTTKALNKKNKILHCQLKIILYLCSPKQKTKVNLLNN